MGTPDYLHGYSEREQERLINQANFLEEKIFNGIDLSEVSRLLEVGCGVGAQSQVILRRYPAIHLTGVDINPAQVARAVENLEGKFPGRYNFETGNAKELPFKEGEFDGAFFCWVLEHVQNPAEILRETFRVLRADGRIVLTEVFNSTLFLNPRSAAVETYWKEFNAQQEEFGGDPCIGAKLGNLLSQAGFSDIQISPRIFHWDCRNVAAKKAMLNYWIELLKSGADSLVQGGRITEALLEQAILDLIKVGEDQEGVFYYAFIQACGSK